MATKTNKPPAAAPEGKGRAADARSELEKAHDAVDRRTRERDEAAAEAAQLRDELKQVRDERDQLRAQCEQRSEAPAGVERVVLNRDRQIGDEYVRAGSVLAECLLAPGVSLNFLVDAVRNGLAGPEK